MTTNYQWLLEMGGAERQEWFDAEHVDGGAAELEAAYAKNRALREHIRKMQDGRNGWHVKAEQADKRIAKLLAQRDEYKLLAEAYKTERDVLRDENLKMALVIESIREQLEDDGR